MMCRLGVERPLLRQVTIPVPTVKDTDLLFVPPRYFLTILTSFSPNNLIVESILAEQILSFAFCRTFAPPAKQTTTFSIIAPRRRILASSIGIAIPAYLRRGEEACVTGSPGYIMWAMPPILRRGS